jgi:hypothetical protein
MRVDNSIFDETGKSKIKDALIDDFISNRVVPAERINIESITSGRLLTSQV